MSKYVENHRGYQGVIMSKYFDHEFLAKHMLADFFACSKESLAEEKEVMDYSLKNLSPMESRRVAIRQQRSHISHIVVRTVLADLPPIQREIFIRKYKKHEVLKKISLDLNISFYSIAEIELAVNKNILNMLRYILTVKDIYSRMKVVNMIHILDLRIAFVEASTVLMPTLNRPWLLSLKIIRQKYRFLYSAMEDIIQRSDTSLHCNVIAEKLRNPFLSSKELSIICHVSQSGINRHLRTYESDMSKYLVA